MLPAAERRPHGSVAQTAVAGCRSRAGTAVREAPLRDVEGMTKRDGTRLVYSSAAGRICRRCGQPERGCRCGQAAAQPVPERPVAKLRMEKAGRGGKTVTVVFGLPDNAAFLEELCRDLKRACGTGGAVTSDGVLIQGDLRERVRDLLLARGFRVKG